MPNIFDTNAKAVCEILLQYPMDACNLSDSAMDKFGYVYACDMIEALGERKAYDEMYKLAKDEWESNAHKSEKYQLCLLNVYAANIADKFLKHAKSSEMKKIEDNILEKDSEAWMDYVHLSDLMMIVTHQE